VILETERLTLRPYRDSDTAAVHAYKSDPVVSRFADFEPHSPDDTERFVAFTQDASHDVMSLAVTIRGEDVVIGGVACWPTEPGVYEMAWEFRRDAWGHGYATEAAKALLGAVAATGSARSFVAHCQPENRASVRVMEKLGMALVRSGRLDRESKGQLVDTSYFEVEAPTSGSVPA